MERIGKSAVRAVAIVPAGEGAGQSKRNGAFDAHLAERPSRASRLAQASLAPATPLAQLRAGMITTEQYIGHKVEEATGHLDGLTPAKVAFIQRQLREAIASEPELRDLVVTLARQMK